MFGAPIDALGKRVGALIGALGKRVGALIGARRPRIGAPIGALRPRIGALIGALGKRVGALIGARRPRIGGRGSQGSGGKKWAEQSIGIDLQVEDPIRSTSHAEKIRCCSCGGIFTICLTRSRIQVQGIGIFCPRVRTSGIRSGTSQSCTRWAAASPRPLAAASPTRLACAR